MYPGYYPPCGTNPSQAMLTSPQSVSPYVHGFAFPPNYTLGGPATTSSNQTGDGLTSLQTTIASPGYLPGFNSLKGSIPIPGYMTMGLSQNGSSSSVPHYSSAYGPVPPNGVSTPITQK